MLEGLEVKEAFYNETVANKDFRFDSDFYTKEPKKNPLLNYAKIGSCLKHSQYGVSISMNEEGVGFPIYRMNEIHSMFCDLEVDKRAELNSIDKSVFKLNDKDVLFNRTNSFEWVGRTGIYRKLDERDFVFASYLVRFVPDESLIFPEFLTAFLNTKYGVWDLKRRARQSINQTNINPEEVKEVEIPLLSLDFQNLIKQCFEIAHQNRIVANKTYTQAEQLLLQELGLADAERDGFEPPNPKVNYSVKSFKNSFEQTGRLDAEYYQLKYDYYLNIIRSYINGYELLGCACHLKDNNYTPNDNFEYQYIELSDIGKSGNITGCTAAFGSELPSRARRIVKSKDVIISSIEGSLQSCAIVDEKYNNALCSTGFYVINSDKINSETLLVLFKSEPLQNILKQNCSGTILTAINKTEFLNIPIPLVRMVIQGQIAEFIKESFALKQQAQQLLEAAKRAVEIAIEQNEEAAMAYLQPFLTE